MNSPTMKNAGLMVGLDLEQPIDCSQMQVYEISDQPEVDEFSMYHMQRKTILHAFVFNEHGEQEDLTITFELKSNRRPKLEKDQLSEPRMATPNH